MIVADTCLVVHLFNETHLTKAARKVLKKDPRWMLPALWEEEYANVLSKLARRNGASSEEVVAQFIYVVSQMNGREVSIDNEQALRIALDSRISVYDAHFVALALDLGTVLVTEDEEILKKCPKLAISMAKFADEGE